MFAPKGTSSLSPPHAPLEVNSQRELLVNNEKFLTGETDGAQD
jgi:TRAP-type C4-dicarboxylate transport system permease small subunit